MEFLAVLPRCDGEFGILPAGMHTSDLNEIRARFVDEAPAATRGRRELIFAALSLHVTMLRRLFIGHPTRFWIDGGFTTHKTWIPRDADLACIVPPAAFELASKDAALPLWTLSNVTARRGALGPEVVTEKLHTMGGLTDAYIYRADQPDVLELARRQWSRVRDREGAIVDGLIKGIVEVSFDG